MANDEVIADKAAEKAERVLALASSDQIAGTVRTNSNGVELTTLAPRV